MPGSRCSTRQRCTAEARANGSSAPCSAVMRNEPASAVVATKFMPSPWKVHVRSALLHALRASLERLGLPAVDLYQIHGPISFRSHAAMAEALATAHQAGLVKAVGVSNYSGKETRSIAKELGARGMALATNQIEFSLLRRYPEANGLLATCEELGVLSPRLFTDWSRSTHRQVFGFQPSTWKAHFRQLSNGHRRRDRRRIAPHR